MQVVHQACNGTGTSHAELVLAKSHACVGTWQFCHWLASVQAPAASQQLPRRPGSPPGRPESCQQRPAVAHLPRQQSGCQPLGRQAAQYTTVDCSTAVQVALLPTHSQ